MSLNRDIYPNLKLRMYTTGIRQNRLARMLGIHEASLSRIMNGFREPTGDVRVQLAEILQSDPDWLFYKMQISDDVAFAETAPARPARSAREPCIASGRLARRKLSNTRTSFGGIGEEPTDQVPPDKLRTSTNVRRA